jgi:putative transposon-encoded protein
MDSLETLELMLTCYSMKNGSFRMKAVFTQIESVVTPSSNSGHIVVPKAWIGKEAIVLKEKENKTKGRR